jgi:hypothetical protein
MRLAIDTHSRLTWMARTAHTRHNRGAQREPLAIDPVAREMRLSGPAMHLCVAGPGPGCGCGGVWDSVWGGGRVVSGAGGNIDRSRC